MRIAHTIMFASIELPRRCRVPLRAPEPGGDRVDHLVERRRVLLRSEPHLGVHHAVVGEVERRLVGHPLDVLGGLHHRERVLEAGEVAEEVLRLGARGEPPLQLVDVGRWQAWRPTDVVGELEDRRGPQGAVEVVVEDHLRSRGATPPA